MIPYKIQVKNVCKIFGARWREGLRLLNEGGSKADVLAQTGCNVGLSDVSLNIQAGEIFVIMGLSGSGKSTLVRHFNRLIDPSAGEILIDGRDVLSMSERELRELRRRHISMVFQGFGLMPHQTVLDNAAFALLTRGEPKTQARTKAAVWLERVGLKGYEDKYPDELSGGMRQRVGLARALAADTDVLLMDEAFSALDPLIRDDMQDQLLSLQTTLHKTIIFITHDLDEALKLGDHIAILRDGRLVQVGTPDEILRSPADDYVRKFVEKRAHAAALPARIG
ncbi:ATP-binding cassette domain-containing protein [Duganella sp. BJB488]|uniref:quaternary amine ABC transporter ATP-binding protein n=1 Tax=unclassified Duganella TaxID=2636909 RepID=UPI000E34AD7B|nr:MULTISPECIES: betaine/proline/choline family ABC transporter ATP-binding protein [unclassified Duganella]RFP13207.1 ATP-binding cassette domain-containing protein [Duganella sp. BJB489]RFP17218.1 ATP-binding cassette domain-containing protein [Duganella sp. BJB488]RFP31562.1 ATP-binding cassette domain-containing protein [Duganella sp. BJB480]RFP09319.1 ATP-binding cassette domain-containing protein [Duganella sp. BJB475]RFP25355.1 ATP-binding cassette domain-containing protein [Duganella s